MLFQLLYSPLKVLGLCSVFLLISLFIKGQFFSVFHLYREVEDFEHRIKQIQQGEKEIAKRFARMKDPEFLEIEVRKRSGLASEGDLVFIFPDKEE